MKVHYTDPYLLNPGHKITIDLVGLGGGGSRVLTELGCMNAALTGLGHPGLHVRCWDPDSVTPSNCGRQLFSESDMGMNKAVVLTTRINRFFGLEWEAMPVLYGGQSTSNILITCIDSARGRVMLGMKIEGRKTNRKLQPFNKPLYWLDLGNGKKTGQCIVGTFHPVKQPRSKHSTRSTLPTVTKKFPQLKKMKDTDNGPSCSVAEALEKQSLFINKAIAVFACDLLLKMLTEGMLPGFHGAYISLESFNVNPINIQ